MAGALHRLQEGKGRGGIEGAGDLAGAAADLVLLGPVHIGGCGLEARLLGALAHDLVIGEDLPRIDDVSVDLGGAEGEIAAAVFAGVGEFRQARAQQIVEELPAQALPGHVRPHDLQRDRDRVPGLGGIPEGPGLLHVKAAAHHLIHDGIAAVVQIIGVVGLLPELVINCLKIRLRDFSNKTVIIDFALSEL